MSKHRLVKVLLSFSFLVITVLIAMRSYLIAARSPSIEYTKIVDLGEVEMETIKEVPVEFRNAGNELLKIYDITTSCACTGIEKKDGDKYKKVQSLELNPGTSCDMVIRVRIVQPNGYENVNRIAFQTNDPAYPVCNIDIVSKRTLRGIEISPKECILGEVINPDKKVVDIKVFDRDKSNRKLLGVHSTLPSVVAVEFIANNDTSNTSNELGVIRVSTTGETGNIRGNVIAFFSDGRELNIPIIGKVSDEIEIYPLIVTLRPMNGKLIGAAYCRSNRELPLECLAISDSKSLSIDTNRNQKVNAPHLHRLSFSVDLHDTAESYCVTIDAKAGNSKLNRTITLRRAVP